MAFADQYLSKQDVRFAFRCNNNDCDTKMVVAIPCYDEPEIAKTLLSLFNCLQPNCNVLVVVVINHSEQSPEAVKLQNAKTYNEIQKLKKIAPAWFAIEVLQAYDLPQKHAGVGWARKIGMDFAISLFNNCDCSNGIIVSLDADTLVADNYLQAIAEYFVLKPNNIGATLYFEHLIDDVKLENAVVLYELYMRYYKNALSFAGFPFSLYTVGSAFCVKAQAYVAQGGMNRRKAGEDFYFLHKLVQLGAVGEINNTVVYPSGRVSNRVPFGTGPAIAKYIENNSEAGLTYPLESILALIDIFKNVDFVYRNFSLDNLTENNLLKEFLTETAFVDEISDLRNNCATINSFSKRFYHSFNAFKILKWLNYAVGNFYDRNNVISEANKLLRMLGFDYVEASNAKIMLNRFRELDKNRLI
jgi:hypothetical protein